MPAVPGSFLRKFRSFIKARERSTGRPVDPNTMRAFLESELAARQAQLSRDREVELQERGMEADIRQGDERIDLARQREERLQEQISQQDEQFQKEFGLAMQELEARKKAATISGIAQIGGAAAQTGALLFPEETAAAGQAVKGGVKAGVKKVAGAAKTAGGKLFGSQAEAAKGAAGSSEGVAANAAGAAAGAAGAVGSLQPSISLAGGGAGYVSPFSGSVVSASSGVPVGAELAAGGAGAGGASGAGAGAAGGAAGIGGALATGAAAAGAGFVGHKVGSEVFKGEPEIGGGVTGGAAAGAVVGSAVPVVGTAVGAVVGGAIGGAVGIAQDASVICTELNRQGYLPKKVLDLDGKHRLKYIDDYTYSGYMAWAPTIVKWMRKSKVVTQIVRPIGVGWAYEMAHRVDSDVPGSVVGKVLLRVGAPLCKLIGKFRRND